MGQTHGRLLLRDATRQAALGNTTLALAKTVYCVAAASLSALDPAKRNTALLRGCLHAGTFSAHLGLRTLELYGQNKKGVMP